MSNVNSEKMIPSSSAVPLNSKERLALSAHCFGLMSLNFSVVVQSLYSDQPRFQQKNLQKLYLSQCTSLPAVTTHLGSRCFISESKISRDEVV